MRTRVQHRRTMLAALALTGAAVLAGTGVASSAQAATNVAASQATTNTVVSPATAESWYIYKVYALSSTCKEWGEAYTKTGFAESYKCLWDSPGYALWLDSYDA